MLDNLLNNKEVDRREFLGNVRNAMIAGMAFTLNGCASNLANLDEENVSNLQPEQIDVKMTANSPLPILNGCLICWHNDALPPRLGAEYYKIWRNQKSSSEIGNLENYRKRFNHLPAGHSFSDRHIRDGFFPKPYCEGAHRMGVVPIVRYYFYYDWINVAKGKVDDQLKEFAQGANEFGKPFFFVPYPEVNIKRQFKRVHPWAGGSGKRFVDAYIHMFEVLKKEGMNNAAWSPHYIGMGAGQRFSNFKVPEDMVHIVGFSLYNLERESRQYRDFDTLMYDGYAWAKRAYPSKPIAIWELGTSNSSRQARWIKNAYKRIKKYSRIRIATYAEYMFQSESTFLFDDKSSRAYLESVTDSYFIDSLKYYRHV